MAILTVKISARRVCIPYGMVIPKLTQFHSKNPSETDVAAAERSLARIQQGLAQKRAELGKDAAQVRTFHVGWLSR
jgi:hypothetical protein